MSPIFLAGLIYGLGVLVFASVAIAVRPEPGNRLLVVGLVILWPIALFALLDT